MESQSWVLLLLRFWRLQHDLSASLQQVVVIGGESSTLPS
jgi:hypothetical protein